MFQGVAVVNYFFFSSVSIDNIAIRSCKSSIHGSHSLQCKGGGSLPPIGASELGVNLSPIARTD